MITPLISARLLVYEHQLEFMIYIYMVMELSLHPLAVLNVLKMEVLCNFVLLSSTLISAIHFPIPHKIHRIKSVAFNPLPLGRRPLSKISLSRRGSAAPFKPPVLLFLASVRVQNSIFHTFYASS